MGSQRLQRAVYHLFTSNLTVILKFVGLAQGYVILSPLAQCKKKNSPHEQTSYPRLLHKVPESVLQHSISSQTPNAILSTPPPELQVLLQESLL